MKTKNLLLACLLFVTGGIVYHVSAQGTTVAESDTTATDLIFLVTVDNQLKAMPLETGEIKEHKKKKWKDSIYCR